MLKSFQVACFSLKRSINGQAFRAYSLIGQNLFVFPYTQTIKWQDVDNEHQIQGVKKKKKKILRARF